MAKIPKAIAEIEVFAVPFETDATRLRTKETFRFLRHSFDALADASGNIAGVKVLVAHNKKLILATTNLNDGFTDAKTYITQDGLWIDFDVPDTELGHSTLKEIEDGRLQASVGIGNANILLKDDGVNHMSKVYELREISLLRNPAFKSTFTRVIGYY